MAKKKEVDIEIKVKGDDGLVVSYQDEENLEQEGEKMKAVKKGKKKSSKPKIQSEETLEMLMSVMKPTSASGLRIKKTKTKTGASSINEETIDASEPTID